MINENKVQIPGDAGVGEVIPTGRQAEGIRILSTAPRRDGAASHKRRWGVILAGGDGTRLQKLTRLICGDDRPKQFCPLVSNDTLLEQTRKRALRSIPWDQTIVSLKKGHDPFFLEEPEIRPSQRIVQPSNKGTAPPILHSLLSIEQLDRDALVAILPCDHHYADDQTFTDALESAFDVAARRPSSVVLLGAHPEGPEIEYGWIELGPPACDASLYVRGFCEKPSIRMARRLVKRGSLWNTFVMVGTVGGFLEMIRAAVPELVQALSSTSRWTGQELHIPESAYAFDPVNFSHDVLSVQTDRLITLRLGFRGWSDLGHPERAVAVLKAAGVEPWWMHEWHKTKPPSRVAPSRVRVAVA